MNQSNERERTEEFLGKVERLSQEYSSRWKKERISSRRIVKEARGAVAKSVKSAESFAYFVALQRRVDERYDSLLKTFFRYFAWKRETALLSAIKSGLKLPQNIRAEQAIEEEAERRENGERGGEQADGTDERQEKEKKKGSKETESPSAFARKSDFFEVSADKFAEEEQKESETEEKEEPTAEKEKESSEKEKSEEPTDLFAAKEKAERVGREEKSAPQAPPKTEQAKPKPTDILSPPLESDVLSGVFERDVPPRKSTATRPPDFYERPRFGIREGDDARAFPREPVLPDAAQDAVRDSSNPTERERATEKGDLPTEKPILAENPLPVVSAKEEMSEENRERIRARDAFAKMSEAELESIRQAMQESLDREMASAEARGEIYKLPIVVKEAIEKGSALSKKPTELSSTNPVAKK